MSISEIGGNEPAEAKSCQRPCPNQSCRNGYVIDESTGRILRVCAACDGLGFLRSVVENRKRYYALRNLASELELQSRIGRGLTPQHKPLIDISDGAIPANAEQIDLMKSIGPSSISEHMIGISPIAGPRVGTF